MLRPAIALLLSFWSAAPAASEADPLFRSLDVLSVRITGPLKSLAGDTSDEPKSRAGQFVFTDTDGSIQDQAVKLTPRGNSRRERRVCVFPPLWVDFEKKALRDTLFDGQNKLKLVTHCGRSPRYDQHLIREYLAYRILNLLTDNSFRVRMLRIEYRDDERDDPAFVRPGFLIEHQKRLARRIGADYVKPDSIDREDLDPVHASLVALFQYLLGNVDYSLISGPAGQSCCHNAKLFRLPDDGTLPVPYDFDMSGFVDPPYGNPNRQLKQRNIRQRIYRGYCRPREYQLQAVFQLQGKRAEILQLIAGEPGLDQKHRRRLADYVEAFYKVLDDAKALERNILEACR